MTKTYAILLLLVAIAMLIFGIKAWIKMFSSKEIIKFPFAQKHTEFAIFESGYYAIYIHALNFRLLPMKWIPKIKNTTVENEIQVKRTAIFGIRSNNFDGGRMERFGFKIENSGKYSIEIVESESGYPRLLHSFETAILPKVLFSESEQKDLFISIRKGPSLLQKALLFPQLFLAFVGLFGIIFSSIAIANTKAFDNFGKKQNIENQIYTP